MSASETRVLALCSGSAAETRTLAAYRGRITDVLHTRHSADPANADLVEAALADADVVWVPEGTPQRRLLGLAPALDGVLARGGVVLLFGDHQAGWPKHASWTFRPAGSAGRTVPRGIWRGVGIGSSAAALHHHGVLDPPPGAEVLLTTWDGAAVAYLDWESTPGHTFVSTLDPLAHFGHTGDADAARFLDLLIPWATRTVLPKKGHP
jgi:hypothetical protein